jgi:hypothetical protein
MIWGCDLDVSDIEDNGKYPEKASTLKIHDTCQCVALDSEDLSQHIVPFRKWPNSHYMRSVSASYEDAHNCRRFQTLIRKSFEELIFC